MLSSTPASWDQVPAGGDAERRGAMEACIQLLTKRRSVFRGAETVAQPLERRNRSVNLKHSRRWRLWRIRLPTGGWQSSRLYVQKTHTSTAAAVPTSSSAAPIYDPRTFTTIATFSDHLLLLNSFHSPLRYPCTSGYCKLLLDIRCTSRI
jgi:hypothetical protein